MKWTLTVALLAALVREPSLALAQEPSPAFKAIVSQCIDKVRWTTATPPPRFDAFVTRDGTIKTFGSSYERFLFERCMDEWNWPADPQNEHIEHTERR